MPRLRTRITQQLSDVLDFLHRENLLRLVGLIVVLVLSGAVGLAYFEPKPFLDSLWWAVVTLTTVGYGDISPSSFGGRVIGVVLMFFGIGLLGMFTATVAGIVVERRLRKERGMGSYDFTDHTILCEWNDRTREILRDLRADARSANSPVVLLAEVEAKPVDDKHLYFVRGGVTEENLDRANLAGAATVVIVGDRNLDFAARDAKAVLSILTVESLNPKVYTIVELASEANVRHCERAQANEIIVGSEFSSRLIARASLDHGITRVLSELLSSQFGNDLKTIPVPHHLAGRPFLEVLTEMKGSHGTIVVALRRGAEEEVLTNPDSDTTVEAQDGLVVVSPRPAGEA